MKVASVGVAEGSAQGKCEEAEVGKEAVKTGDFQVLREEMLEMKQLIERLNGKVAAFDGKCDSLDGKFDSLDGKFDSLEKLLEVGTTSISATAEVQETELSSQAGATVKKKVGGKKKHGTRRKGSGKK